MNMYTSFYQVCTSSFLLGGRWQSSRPMKKYVYLMVCSCKTVIYNKFFIFQAPTPEDNNLVTSSEDKIPKVTMLNASSQTITKVSVCEKRGVFVTQLKFSISNT